MEVKYKGFFTLVNIDYKGNFVVMLPEDSEEFLIDDVRMRLVVKNFGYSVIRTEHVPPKAIHQRLQIRTDIRHRRHDNTHRSYHHTAPPETDNIHTAVPETLYRKYARNIPPPFERRSQDILRIQQRKPIFSR